jgi:hypothetical protein
MRKEYLRQLKKRDPIAYYELMDDPMVKGTGDGSEWLVAFVLCAVFCLGLILWVL